MKKSSRAWLIIAVILILAGGILFTFALHSCHWDFAKLSTIQFTSRTYDITETFRNITVKSTTADILLIPSDNNLCRVECYEKEAARHTVEVRNHTLTITITEELQIENLLSISSSNPRITIYLPKGEYGDLSIRLTTGDVTVRDITQEEVLVNLTTGKLLMEDVTADSMDFSVNTGSISLKDIQCAGTISTQSTTGKVHLTDIRCSNLHSQGRTGDILLHHVIASEECSVKRTSGDIELEACDAAALLLKVTTGDITGTLLTDKVFIPYTTTGTVEVPNSVTGGTCEVHTTSGDILITIP